MSRPGCADEYALFTCDTLTTPQILQRTTAGGIARALQLSSSVSWRSNRSYRLRVRFVCLDRYAAQFSAGTSLEHACGGEYVKLHVGCDIHKSVTCMCKGIGLIDGAISGMIHAAKSLHLGGWM
eukprot:9467180-Pyramimonas_sp.AAC.1